MKYLFIIPARAGSKGITNKNIIEINGTHLIGYTIATSLAAQKELNDCEVIVSTDSEKIREISLNYGANVPFLRNKSISGDLSPSSEYINHAIDYFEKIDKSFQNIVILQPTSPLRTKEDIISSINLFDKHNEETLISAYVENHLNDKATYNLEGLYGKPNSVNHGSGGRRQDDETIVVRNGAIYIFSISFFKKEKKLISDTPLIYLMKKSRSINIDTYEDLYIAEKMFQILMGKTD